MQAGGCTSGQLQEHSSAAAQGCRSEGSVPLLPPPTGLGAARDTPGCVTTCGSHPRLAGTARGTGTPLRPAVAWPGTRQQGTTLAWGHPLGKQLPMALLLIIFCTFRKTPGSKAGVKTDLGSYSSAHFPGAIFKAAAFLLLPQVNTSCGSGLLTPADSFPKKVCLCWTDLEKQTKHPKTFLFQLFVCFLPDTKECHTTAHSKHLRKEKMIS